MLFLQSCLLLFLLILTDDRLCTQYDGKDLTPIKPVLGPEQKIHYILMHDETCFHANDQDEFVWMKDGEMPLRSKSRGRIVHISDFIIEDGGRLFLTPEQIAENSKLPKRPTSVPTSTSSDHLPNPCAAPPTTAPKKKQGRRKPTDPNSHSAASSTAKKNRGPRKIQPMSQAHEAWAPPLPVSAYRLESTDARRIIHPGAGHDMWWDMEQLIAQVRRFHNL